MFCWGIFVRDLLVEMFNIIKIERKYIEYLLGKDIFFEFFDLRKRVRDFFFLRYMYVLILKLDVMCMKLYV